MTTALDSVESIVLLARTFFREDMHPYFNSEYLDVCKNMIGKVLGTTQFKYVQTIVSLPEPIWCNGAVIVISVPMMQNLIDRPYIINSKPVEYVENFNIFQKYQMRNRLEKRMIECEDVQADKYAFTTDLISDKRCTKKRRYDEEPIAEPVRHSNAIFVKWSSLDGVRNFEPITRNQTFVLLLFRLIICVEHWLQLTTLQNETIR